MPSREVHDAPGVPGIDKVAHIGLFGVWAFLWTSYREIQFIPILIAGAALGLSIELLQEWMQMGRSFEWWDLVADVFGVSLGFVFRQYLLPSKQRD